MQCAYKAAGRFFLAVMLTAAMLWAVPSHAQDTQSAQQQIDALMEKIRSDPENLDYYFEYAKVAEAIGEHAKAARAYETMLKINPALDRVRLDLGMAYLKLQKVEQAKTLFQEVLDRKPPEQVKHNIEQVMAQIKKTSAGHRTGGFVQLGFISDSNANSAPGTGSVTVFDTNLPLTGDSLGQADTSMTLTAGLQHGYRFAPDAEGRVWDWNSSLTAHQTLQQDQDQLNLQLISARTGPTLTLPEIQTSIGLQGGATAITLDTHHYLDIYNAELSVNKAITPKFSLEPSVSIEYRDFHNSPTVTTFEDRTGIAYQAELTGRYLLTEKDLLEAAVSFRDEGTKRGYYDNRQLSASLSHSHMFEQGFYTNVRGALRRSSYDDPDLFISARTRSDLEKSIQLLVGKSFEHGINASVTYLYRDVNSNIQNYAYDNHRIMANLGWSF